MSRSTPSTAAPAMIEHPTGPAVAGPAWGFASVMQFGLAGGMIRNLGHLDWSTLAVLIGAVGTLVMALVAASREVRAWVPIVAAWLRR